ncbi:recombination/repair exonuclease [Lactobacillus phage Lbab1]|nr:recombination/repair exonuclease [Lactobacillus phage Lbab1]
MKGLLFFTDFHAHLWSEFASPVPDPKLVNDRFSQQVQTLHDIFDFAAKNDYGVIHGGDLFHARSSVDTRVINAVFNTIASYSKVPTILLRGNHDSVSNQMDSPASIDIFSQLPNVTVVDTPTYKDLVIDDKKVHIEFMPYGEDVLKMKESLNSQSERAKQGDADINLEVAHLGVDGAKQGLSTHRLAFAFSVADLHPESYDAVYVGHIHLRQKLAENMWYGGSTMQLTFNDQGQEKGYDVLTINDGKPSWKFFKANYTPFITLDSWSKEDEEKFKNYYVRLQLPEDKAKQLAPESNIRLEAKVKVDNKVRMDIDSNTSPVKVTESYMGKYYPSLSKVAESVIMSALGGGTND